MIFLDLYGPRFSDADLKCLSLFPSLQILNLPQYVTDVGLEHLKEVPHLENLTVHSDQITDAGLEHLKEVARLRDLRFSGEKITDAALQHLKWTPQLRSLDLRTGEDHRRRIGATQGTDAGPN